MTKFDRLWYYEICGSDWLCTVLLVGDVWPDQGSSEGSCWWWNEWCAGIHRWAGRLNWLHHIQLQQHLWCRSGHLAEWTLCQARGMVSMGTSFHFILEGRHLTPAFFTCICWFPFMVICLTFLVIVFFLSAFKTFKSPSTLLNILTTDNTSTKSLCEMQHLLIKSLNSLTLHIHAYGCVGLNFGL